MKLNEKIYKCRKEAGLSQEALAEKMSVSRQAVSKWELGTAVPDLSNIVVLSEVFGVTTDWLLKNDDNAGEDSEPKSESRNETENTQTSLSDAHHYSAENLGWIKRFAARYGWLSGVYIALSSAGITLIGIIAKTAASLMVSGVRSASDSMMESFGNFGYSSPQIIYDGDVPPEIIAQIQGEMVHTPNSMFDSFGSSSDAMLDVFASSNPVSIAANIIIILGILGMIGGTVLAVYLRHIGRKSE